MSATKTRKPKQKVTDAVQMRIEFYQEVSALPLADAVRRMRAIAGKTQAEYAHLIGVA